MDRGKKAGARPGTAGSGSPAAAGERWTSERQSSDQGALFKEATSELRAGVRRRHRMAGLRKGLLEEEEPLACLPVRAHGAHPHGVTSSRGARPYGGRVLTGTCPHGRGVSSRGRGSHGGVSSREGRVLTGGGVLTGRVLTGACPHGRGASSPGVSSRGRVLTVSPQPREGGL